MSEDEERYTPETYEEWFAAKLSERRRMTWPCELLQELERERP